MMWRTAALSTLLDEAGSGIWGNPAIRADSEHPVLRSTNIRDGELFLDQVAMRSVSRKVAGKYALRNKDILVTTSSGSRHLIGKNALFNNPHDGCVYLFSNFTYRLRTNKRLILPEFLYFYLNSQRAKAELIRIQSTTSGLRNLNTKLYLAQEVPLPPISEQRRIVEILDQADRLRKLRQEADKKAERILPALFVRLFGDPATNPKGWEPTTLGEVIADTRKGLYKPAEFYGTGVRILKMFNIQNGEWDLCRVDLIDVSEDEYKAYHLLPGDILINRVNTPELVGKCAVITAEVGKAVFESKNIRLRVKADMVTPEYLAYWINSPFGHGSLRSAVKHAIGMATINNADLRNAPMLRPPYDLQQEWATTVRGVRELRKKVNISLVKLNSLFANVIHRALTGELTATWREAHMEELLAEMKEQAKLLRPKEAE